MLLGCLQYGACLLVLFLLWTGVVEFAKSIKSGDDDSSVAGLAAGNIGQPDYKVEEKSDVGDSNAEDTGASENNSDIEDKGTSQEHSGIKDAGGLSEADIQEARRIYNDNKELLVLVNKENALSQDYDSSLRSICNGRLKASSYLYDALTDMLHDAGEAGYSFWIPSAYRSRQWQQSLVNQDVRKFMEQGMSEEEALEKTLEETMPAGHSEHETGLALDILCSDNMNMDISQEQSAGNIWLREHCHEYGFILRYPKEDEEITGISYEPWHFRYVGKEAAGFIVEHGLTLEEFCKMRLE